jgi:hypothetical protein
VLFWRGQESHQVCRGGTFGGVGSLTVLQAKNSMILTPLFDLKFLSAFSAGDVGTLNQRR